MLNSGLISLIFTFKLSCSSPRGRLLLKFSAPPKGNPTTRDNNRTPVSGAVATLHKEPDSLVVVESSLVVVGFIISNNTASSLVPINFFNLFLISFNLFILIYGNLYFTSRIHIKLMIISQLFINIEIAVVFSLIFP